MNGITPKGRQMPSYHEIVLGIPAMTDNIPGMYCVQLYLDDITAGSQVYPTMTGQLVYGYPKREAKIEMSFTDTMVTVNASRHGQDIISASFSLGVDLPIPTDHFALYQYGLKYIPSIEEGALPDVVKLTRWEMKPGIPTLVKSATAASSVDKIVLDTGRSIPVRGIVDASYALTGFEFGYGEVVWDYIVKA
jgi:acetoacetate decarboxylase